MGKRSGQRFIGGNRPPRVQIEYEVFTNNSSKKVQVPFVMGVMADLSGDPSSPLPDVAARSFQAIDVDNFDDIMKAMKPRVVFEVDNAVGEGGGKMKVDLSFESMEDFSPAAVARKVDSLNKLLEARTQLSNLLTFMDGRSGAEDLIGRLLNDPALLKSLTEKPKPADEPK